MNQTSSCSITHEISKEQNFIILSMKFFFSYLKKEYEHEARYLSRFSAYHYAFYQPYFD